MLTQLRLNNLINFLVACLLAGLLAACGGGGTNDGCVNVDPSRSGALPGCGGVVTNPGNGGSTTGYTLGIGLSDSNGAVFNALTPAKGAKVTVVLKTAAGQAVSNAVIAFTSTDTSALFTPSTGTALTDANGTATVQLAAGSQAGAFTVTATYAASSPATKASASYTVTFAGANESASTMTLAMTDSSGAAFNALTPSKGASVSATLKNNQNLPIAGAVVAFSSTDSSAVMTPLTALTDANGVAKIQLAAGSQAGAFTLNASSGTTRASANYTVTFAGGTSAPSLVLSMLDSNGTAFNVLTPTRPARLVATVKDNQNQPVANTVVTFTSTDGSAVFSPAIGTALTDASGVTSVQLAAGTQAGAFTASASASVNGSAVKVTAGYTVSFANLTLGELQISPSTLAAGGNASISVSVQENGTPYTQPITVSFTSPCVAAGKATIGSPVTTQNGLATASYTDKGCASADTITATAALPNATLTKSAVITVLAPSVGSIKFISVDSTNIALKGTGGPDRPEYSSVKFQVFDTNGNPLAGRQVNFVFADSGTTTTTGGLTLSPSSATTAADGTVSTIVSNGLIPTSIRVAARVTNSNPLLTTVSSMLVVSTGVPDQLHISISAMLVPCEPKTLDVPCTAITAALADHFGNAVPDGTAVNFSAEGGVINGSCLTLDGYCKVQHVASNPRPADGRLSILAYALGEETLIDNNGNNVYDAGDSFSDKSPDIYRDDNEDGKWNPGEPCIGPNTNGSCSTPGDGKYNGVLRTPQLPSTQTLYVQVQRVLQFSNDQALINFSPSSLTCTPGAAVDVAVTVTDINGLIMPGGTKITFETNWGAAGPVSPSSASLPLTVLNVGQVLSPPTYALTVTCPSIDSAGKLIVTVTSPSGFVTTGTKTID